MLFDCHIHLTTTQTIEATERERRALDPRLLAAYERRWKRDLAKRGEPPKSDEAWSADETARRWLAEFDRHGVTGGAFLLTVPLHEELSNFVRVAPDRLVGVTTVNPLEPGAAADLERAVTTLGIGALKLYPCYHRYHVDDPRCEPVFAAAERLAIPILIHFGVSISALASLAYGNPLPLANVALRHPATPFLLCHFSTGFFREALLLGEQYDNVFAESSSSNSWRWKLPEPLSTRDVFLRALEVFGPERVVFGTDSSFFPRGWRRNVHEEQRRAVESIGLSETERAAIFGGNFVRLLPASVRDRLRKE